MHQHVLLYIKQGLEAHSRAFSPIIIIEDQYLQTFVHTLGLTHLQFAHTYAVCPATITNTIQSYIKNGIADIIKYNISPNSSAALRKADGRTEAHLIQIACGPVPEGHSSITIIN